MSKAKGISIIAILLVLAVLIVNNLSNADERNNPNARSTVRPTVSPTYVPTTRPTIRPTNIPYQTERTYDLLFNWVKVIKEERETDIKEIPEIKPEESIIVRFNISNLGPSKSPPAVATVYFEYMGQSLFAKRLSIEEIPARSDKTYDLRASLIKPKFTEKSITITLKVTVAPPKEEREYEKNLTNNEMQKQCLLVIDAPQNEKITMTPSNISERPPVVRQLPESIKLEVKVPSGSTEKWMDKITISSPEVLTLRFIPYNIITKEARLEISDKPFGSGGKNFGSKWFKIPKSGQMEWFQIETSKYLPKKPGETASCLYTRIVPALKKEGGGYEEKPGISNAVTISYTKTSGSDQKIDIPEEEISHPGEHRWRTDFNGDKKDDIIAFDRENGIVHVSLSSGTGFLKKGDKWHESFCRTVNIPPLSDTNKDGKVDVVQPARYIQIPSMGDFNGDKKVDIISFSRYSAYENIKPGQVTVALSNGNSFGSKAIWLEKFCTGNKIPAIGDFDGDGKDDVAYFMRSSLTGNEKGNVYVALSTGNGFSEPQIWHDNFCFDKEIPLAGDFDGDGKDDIASLVMDTKHADPTVGNVYVALSTGKSFSGNNEKWLGLFCVEKYEIPLVGDFNGDGKDDIACIKRGSPGGEVDVAISNGKTVKNFQAPKKWFDYLCAYQEIPVAGDFDGDKIDDIAIFSHDVGENEKRGDVNVILSSGVEFKEMQKWHDFFCIGSKVPSTFAALYPSLAYLKNGEICLKNLNCILTESSGQDNCKLCVFADGKLVNTLNKKMGKKNDWQLNLKVPFYQNAKIELWDVDSPDADDHLGTILVTLQDKPGDNIDRIFHHDEAKYTLTYSLMCLGEDKHKMNASDALENFSQSKAPGKFTHIVKKDLINEIRGRIENPTIMRQSKQQLCGPITILVALAMKDPERYVIMCRSMFENGEFKSYSEVIKPGSHITTAKVPDNMAQVDWMLAASMRDYENDVYDYEEDGQTSAI